MMSRIIPHLKDIPNLYSITTFIVKEADVNFRLFVFNPKFSIPWPELVEGSILNAIY